MQSVGNTKTLVVIAGPTAVGKTATAIALAKHYSTHILSADSRQFYREMKIGTAMPGAEELAAAPHHFIADRSIKEEFSAGKYEQEAIAKINELFKEHDILFMAGGSGLFIDAICNGFDEFEEVPAEIRDQLRLQYNEKGLDWLQQEVAKADPHYYLKVDIRNPQRLLRALEVTLATGKPYSSYTRGEKKQRDFNVIKILLNLDREELYFRINERVLKMLDEGWLEEAKHLYPHRHLNALNTVGYKELFMFIEGKIDYNHCVALIQQNTRRYAKRQLTWFRNDDEFTEFKPDQITQIITFIDFVKEKA